jgi:hypothetical protein
MTPAQLRTIITRYQKARNLPSFTQAAEALMVEIGYSGASVWALLRGTNGIREIVEKAINNVMET